MPPTATTNLLCITRAAPAGGATPPSEPSPLSSSLPSILMVAGILLLVIILMSKQKNRGRRSTPASEPTQRLADLRQAAAGRESLDSVKVDVEELAHRLASQLDNKAARIEKLIADADDRLSRLEQSVAAQPAAPVMMPTLTNQHDDPTRARIYELADKGHTPIEIARQLDQPTGNVELILSLRSA